MAFVKKYYNDVNRGQYNVLWYTAIPRERQYIVIFWSEFSFRKTFTAFWTLQSVLSIRHPALFQVLVEWR